MMRKSCVSWRRAILSVLIGGGVIVIGVSATFPWLDASPVPSLPLPRGIRTLEPGWRLRTLKQLPEEVTSLAVGGKSEGCNTAWIFAGTAPEGSVYRIHAWSSHPQSHTLFCKGMGDQPESGACSVSGLAVRDVDHDGLPELLCWTNQTLPRGRPRLYVWSMTPNPELRAIACPEVESHTSHGLGLLERPGTSGDSAFIAYSGHGEVIECRLLQSESAAGFRTETLAWKRVEQLPNSGEAVQAADADNDGETDLCVAAGDALRCAAIHIYTSPGRGDRLRLKRVLNEDGRFGNVRFLVGRTRDDGLQDVIAWWSTGLGEGGCEITRYRLGPEGIRERQVLTRGTALALWPKDGQTCLADLDQDGRPEVWFATPSGNVWRYDPGQSEVFTHVLRVEEGIGPIASAPVTKLQGPYLLLGSGQQIIRLEKGVPARAGQQSL